MKRGTFSLGLFLALASPAAFSEPAPGLAPEVELKKQQREDATQKLEHLADTIGKRLETLRSLSFLHPVKKGVQSRAELREYLIKVMNEKQPRERLEAWSRAYALVGLIPRGIDLQQLLLDLLQQQVAGFYDPDVGSLFLINEWSFSQTAIIAHELTHAIQDQHFNLKSLPMEDETREDLVNAIKSVVEGEAMFVMMKYLGSKYGEEHGLLDKLMGKGFKAFLRQLDQGSVDVQVALDDLGNSFLGMDQLSGVPKVIQQALVFPYLQGLVFVHRAWRTGGWKAVDALYRDMPQSTEQVMHPGRYYVDRDPPTLIEYAEKGELAPAGFELNYHSVVGELYLSVLFKDVLGSRARRNIWEGWDGDHLLYFRQPGTRRQFFIWSTIWDSRRDAAEFEAACRDLASRQSLPATETGGKPAPALNHLIQRYDNEVIYLGGNVDGHFLEEAAAKAWRTRSLRVAAPVRARPKTSNRKNLRP